MEMRHLHTFVVAAELQSFTRTAESLGVTQAAVSQHVAALEKELRTALFDRGPRSVTLTQAGRSVYESATKVLELVDQIRASVGQSAAVLRGTISIAASTVPSESLVPELLAAFRKRYPDVRESVCVSDSDVAMQAVESGVADVGFVGELPRSAKLRARAIAQDELTLIVGPSHPFARTRGILPEDICGQPLIVRESGSGSRRCVEEALAEAGITLDNLTITMQVNSNDAIRAAVEQGIGIAFLSTRTAARAIQDGRLVVVKIQDVRPVRHLYAITDPQRMPSRVVRAFLEFLNSSIASIDA